MPGGLDRPFPPENRPLWEDFLTYSGAVLISEFPFGTAASALTLRKRNKLIVAFARGVLVGQSSTEGGAMNAYRFALEQRKPIATFAADSTPDTSGNALIAAKRRPRDAVFPSDCPDPEAYQGWLLQLSSST
jgi:predicted Rossmann fold nucleotide-binding protein DprA/Smf involved in DNA uptake